MYNIVKLGGVYPPGLKALERRQLRMAKKKTFSEATISTVRRLVPIDDAMFQKMCEEEATCQEIITTILDEPVKVISVVPQNSIGNL